MAVAQAQRAVADLAAELEKRGVEVLYAIHPVAGRMPGHMNVLLAEADVPYDKLKEMDDINGEFARTDVVAGDRRQRRHQPRRAHRRRTRRSTACRSSTSTSPAVGDRAQALDELAASPGIDNPLFYDPKTAMLFGDAKSSVSEVLGEVQQL